MSWTVTPALPVVESDATSITPTPATGTAGALLVLLCSQENRGAPTVPTGWTDGGEVVTASSSTACQLLYRIGDGTATDSPTVSFVGSQTRHAVILKITGQAASSPFDTGGTVGSGDATNANVIQTPALTLAESGELLVAVTVNGLETASYTWPGTWTEHVDHGTVSGAKPHRFSVATRQVTAGGSYSPESVALLTANNRRGMVVVAFKPAATVGSPWYYYAQQAAAAQFSF